MTFGEKLKSLRNEKRITQESLAEALDVSRSAIAKWEMDSGFPEVSNLRTIAKYFGVSVDELLDEAKDAEAATPDSTISFKQTEYSGKFCDIELTGWNDGVHNARILGEDEDFIFYQKQDSKESRFGMVAKRLIISITETRKSKPVETVVDPIDRNYFCGKRVFIELASKEGLIQGFFDFASDDYLDVVVHSFSETKLRLDFGKELELAAVSIVEEL